MRIASRNLAHQCREAPIPPSFFEAVDFLVTDILSLSQHETPQDAFRIGTDLAGLTHGQPNGFLTAGVLAVLILALTDGASLPEALAVSKALLREEPDHQETLRAIQRAEAIAQLGQGWIAEEALAIAVYCALVARGCKRGVILAVNHDGDSDSTGSIVGNLLGAMHGVKKIPEEWLAPWNCARS